MVNMQLCILLSISLLASGIGRGTASSGGVMATRGAAPPDTSPVFRGGAGWNEAASWSRFDGSLRPEDGRSSAQNLRTYPFASRARWAETATKSAPTADPNIWGANGHVLDMARSGNTLYIAGSFRSVGENTGGFVPIDARTGELLRPFPKVAGSVFVIVPDGSGGWYIGGNFTGVGGRARSCLAQIRFDGSVSDWSPIVTGSPSYIDPPFVDAIAILGDQIYVGGGFREIGGLPRVNLGCVGARTGAVQDWNPVTHVDGWVYALAVHDTTVYVGGLFTSIGGEPRSYLAAIGAATGAVTPWMPNPDYAVRTLLVRNSTLLVGGQFGTISGSSRPYLAALDIHTAQLLPFDANASGVYVEYVPTPRVEALALAGDTLYVAGNFTQIGGEFRPSLAALNVTTGTALEWAPDTLGPRYEGFPPPLCQTLAVNGGAIYVGGWFDTVAGHSRPFVAQLDRETGAVSEWNPKPDLAVYALATTGDMVYAGGGFRLVGEWKHRAGLAAIDLRSGTVKPWNPNPDGRLCTALALSGGRVLVSGDFANIGGMPKPRRCLAALDTLNGEATEWDPGANSVAVDMMLDGDTLYVGGEFTEVGGQPRNYLASIDASSGAVTGWNPSPNNVVLAMTRSEETFYFGGLFYVFAGVLRRGVAAVDATTGAITPWTAGTDIITVDALLANGNTLYVGGGFSQIGGQPRTSLAAIDAGSGEIMPWNPHLTAWGTPTRVRALAMHEGSLYVGGDFGSIGGRPRICLAAVDTSTGLATDWDPGLDGLVWSLAVDEGSLYVGGIFDRAGGLPAAGLAAFSLTRDPVPAPLSFGLGQNIPNPAQSSSVIRFTLPHAAPVTLSIYDLQGRRVATPLDGVLMSAGPNDVLVRPAGWKPGIYLYRLETGGRSATRKMIVMK